MDLRSGVPYWLRKNGWLNIYPPLQGDLNCDVLVVGGGITGALVTYRLSQAGVSVIAVDKRDIGHGSTVASTSLLLYELDADLLTLAEVYGTDTAVRAYRMGWEAIAELEELATTLHVDCEFARRPSLYLASRKRHAIRLREEFEFRAKHGFDVQWWDEDPIRQQSPFSAPAAIFSQGDAEIDAFRLTHALFQRSTDPDAQMLSFTRADY